MDKKKYYIHQGQDGPIWFDVEAVKSMSKFEFAFAHRHIPGAADLYHAITGFPKLEEVPKEEAETTLPEGTTAAKPPKPKKADNSN